MVKRHIGLFVFTFGMGLFLVLADFVRHGGALAGQGFSAETRPVVIGVLLSITAIGLVFALLLAKQGRFPVNALIAASAPLIAFVGWRILLPLLDRKEAWLSFGTPTLATAVLAAIAGFIAIRLSPRTRHA